MSKLIFLVVFLLFSIQISWSKRKLAIGDKRRVIGDCTVKGIDRIGCNNNMLREFLSDMVCCAFGILDSHITTAWATCKCNGGGEKLIPEVTDKHGDPPSIDGYPNTECWVNETHIDKGKVGDWIKIDIFSL